MSRTKQYIDTDVLTEAKRRIHHIFDIFDTVVVMFSGGKDSLAVLHLTKEVQEERGITGPVNVVFRDEELIPDSVINFVNEYRQKNWVKMVWFTVPLSSEKFILGRSFPYVQWDVKRPWVRPKPEWATNLPDGDDRVFDQYTMDGYTAAMFTGKVALMTGVRASESLIRLRSSINKLNENYINSISGSSVRNAMLCKPIFDWEEADVFKYFYENSIRYCPIYDSQLWAGESLRVSTPLHSGRAKKMKHLLQTDPEFYGRLIEVFPEMQVQMRYWDQFDHELNGAGYNDSYEGVRRWIEENFDDADQRTLALKRFDSVLKRAATSPEKHSPKYLLRAFQRGDFTREILPDTQGAKRGTNKRAS